jgi:hypothetical protein
MIHVRWQRGNQLVQGWGSVSLLISHNIHCRRASTFRKHLWEVLTLFSWLATCILRLRLSHQQWRRRDCRQVTPGCLLSQLMKEAFTVQSGGHRCTQRRKENTGIPVDWSTEETQETSRGVSTGDRKTSVVREGERLKPYTIPSTKRNYRGNYLALKRI